MAAGFEHREPTIKNYYLLVIALDYQQGHAWPGLHNPVKDANKLLNVLTTRYTFDTDDKAIDLRESTPHYKDVQEPIPIYNTTRTICLYNQQATFTAVKEALHHIKKDIGPDDGLLIYFSGHGALEDGILHMILADTTEQSSGLDRSLTANQIIAPYRDYKTNPKCRHLLLILDCCHGGAAKEGFRDPNPDHEPYSRKILSSCWHNELASDGTVSGGSHFTEQLVNQLQSSPDRSFEFGDKLLNHLAFAKTAGHLPIQHATFEDVRGVKVGRGSLFIDRGNDQPDLLALKKSFTEHLDFTEPRASLQDYFFRRKSALNIIVTQQYPYKLQPTLLRVIFRWLQNKEHVDFKNERWHQEGPLQLPHNSGSTLWDVLHSQIKDPQGAPEKNNAVIVDWLFSKLHIEGKCHVIVWFYFDFGEKERIEEISAFWEEFSARFQECLDSGEYDPAALGKMFLVIADERKGTKGFGRHVFEPVPREEVFNFITAEPRVMINVNHFGDWKEAIQHLDKCTLVGQLGDHTFSALTGPDREEITYEETVHGICRHLNLNDTEITEINTYLFDFQKNSLL